MYRCKNESAPVWRLFEKEKRVYPELQQQNMMTDTVVVGGGIAGLTTAYVLQKGGHQVILLEAWDIAAGETSRTTAHLSCVLDDGLAHLESVFGREQTRLAVESHKLAIDRIDAIVRDNNISCDFERVDGYLVAAEPSQDAEFEKEAEASTRAGFDDMERLPEVPVKGITLGKTLRYTQQAAFNITPYMEGLAAAFLKMGGQIYTKARVTEVKGGRDAHVVTESGHRISASNIVIATNTPVNDRVTMHTKQAAYRSYAIACEVKKDSYPNFLLWDLAEPYHYVRLLRGTDKDWLVIGGEDHKTGQGEDAEILYARIEKWARAHIAGLGAVTHRWSGQIMEPVDSLGFIGRNPGDDNVFIITGDSGHGITQATIAGGLISDLIRGRENPYDEIYDPARKSLRTAGTFLKENANMAACLVKGHVKSDNRVNVEALQPGEAGIERRGLHEIAAYRDTDGTLYQCSAVCTHLGSTVKWNAGEKTWDCPCHGSRFRVDGQVLNGPASAALPKIEGLVSPYLPEAGEEAAFPPR
jgi:glycine/D-amino acid oxidase-like deaminating enzyme/nitrite reductase/ring-hydroxylating ferredoxin subunit